MKFPYKIIKNKPEPIPDPPKEEPKDAAMVVTNLKEMVKVEEELEPDEVPQIVSKIDPESGAWNLQLVSSGNVYSGVSIEDALARGLGTETKYYDWYISTGVLRKPINLTAAFATRGGFETTISCIDKKGDPEKEEYKAVKEKIDEVNRRVNMDHVLYITIIKRLLYGRAGWEIVTGNVTGKIMKLSPLRSSYIYPTLNSKTGEFMGIDYSADVHKFIPPNRLLYFTLDTLENSETSWKGVSSVRSVEREIKIKKNLQRDLLYAARSLWAPIVIYTADTRGLTPEEKSELFDELRQDLRPGGIVVTNKAVEAKVVQYNPDINNLIRSIELQDQEIIGNYGIPKSLLSREKTMARATLEFSIKAFYESTISQEQAYLKRELERQWYDPLVKLMGYGDKIRIRHEWKPIIQPESVLIDALVKAYAAGVIGADEFFRRLGWEIDRIPSELERPTPPQEPASPKGDKNETDEN